MKKEERERTIEATRLLVEYIKGKDAVEGIDVPLHKIRGTSLHKKTLRRIFGILSNYIDNENRDARILLWKTLFRGEIESTNDLLLAEAFAFCAMENNEYMQAIMEECNYGQPIR